MSSRNKPSKKASPARCITKTISLPSDMEKEASQKRIHNVHEMNWSKYVRSLVRADLAAELKPAA